MVIKKLNDDNVTKYALQNEVSSSIILNSLDITLETRALARLAGHKFIIDEIQNFRNKYPDWKLCITDLLNELGAKYRAKKKSNKNNTVNVKTEIKTKILKNKTIKNTEKFEDALSETEGSQSEPENQSVSEGTLSKPEDQSVSEGAQSDYEEAQSESENATKSESSLVQKILPNENKMRSDEEQNNMSKISKLLISNNKVITKNKEECLSTSDKSLHYSPIKINVLNTKLPKKNLHLSTNEILDNTDVNLDKNASKRKAVQSVSNKEDYKKKRNTVNEIKPVCETVDSFFMTADNKDYMSVYKPPPTIKRDVEEHKKVEYQKPIKEFFSKGKKMVFGKQNSISNRRERRQQQVEEFVDTALHPSWEAKRKQKSLAKFEGKKITFDDED